MLRATYYYRKKLKKKPWIVEKTIQAKCVVSLCIFHLGPCPASLRKRGRSRYMAVRGGSAFVFFTHGRKGGRSTERSNDMKPGVAHMWTGEKLCIEDTKGHLRFAEFRNHHHPHHHLSHRPFHHIHSHGHSSFSLSFPGVFLSTSP